MKIENIIKEEYSTFTVCNNKYGEEIASIVELSNNEETREKFFNKLNEYEYSMFAQGFLRGVADRIGGAV